MCEAKEIVQQHNSEVMSPDHNCTFISHTRSWLENEKLVRHGGSLLILGLLFWCTAFKFLSWGATFNIFGSTLRFLSNATVLFFGVGAGLLLTGVTMSFYYGLLSRSLKSRLNETLTSVGEKVSFLPTGEVSLSRDINTLKENCGYSKVLVLYSVFYLLAYLYFYMKLFSLSFSEHMFFILLGPFSLGIFILPCYVLHRYVGMVKGFTERIEEKLPAIDQINEEKEEKEAYALSELRRHSSIFWRSRYLSYVPLLALLTTFLITNSAVLIAIITGTLNISLYLNGLLKLFFFSVFLALVFLFAQILIGPIMWFLHWKMSRSQEQVDNIFDGALHQEHDVLQTLEAAKELTIFKKHSAKFSFAAVMSLFANFIVMFKFHGLFAGNGMEVVFTTIMAAVSFFVWLQISNYLEGKNSQSANEMFQRLSVQKK